jgi:tetratricopeptide (TPR) repeat protein
VSSKNRWALLVALVVIVVAPTLVNGFVNDDVRIITDNSLLHSLRNSPQIWESSYWPSGRLYRPLTMQLFAIQWAVGGGDPLIFHLTNGVLYLLVVLAYYRLASRLLPRTPAFVSSAVLICHPVHTEVVANIVGQSELLVAVIALVMVERYLTWRERGDLTLWQRWALVLMVVGAIAAKETGYIFPALLFAAEITIVKDQRGMRERMRALAPLVGLFAGVVVAALLLRAILLGSLGGETPATAFDGLSSTHRAIAMLSIVPQWLRLLTWPSHLQGEYGPPGLPVDTTIGFGHLFGLGIVVAGIGAGMWARRSSPAVTFGLLWAVIALAPVSNVFFATGVVLAERTLFLPSCGFTLAIGAGLGMMMTRSAPVSRIALATIILITIAGAVRSMSRARTWSTQERYFRDLTIDAPLTYRAWMMKGIYDLGEHRYTTAEQALARALELYPRDPMIFENYGQVLRVTSRYDMAITVLAKGVTIYPYRTTMRSRLIESAVAVGDTNLARAVAQDAVALGQPEFEATLRRLKPAP